MSGLPADLDAAVLIVLHIPRESPSALPNILRRTGALPAYHAVDGEELAAGQIYVAPHAWSPRSLLDEQTDNLEAALWMALRALEEKAELSRRVAESAAARGATRTAERYLTVASDAEEAAQHIRRFITRLSVLGHRVVDLEGAS